jgi:tetratricopeptide (TPR) repeat protein
MSKPSSKKRGKKPASKQPSGIDAALQQAQALHQAGNAQQAAALYQQILQARPDHFDALNMFARLMIECGRGVDALQLMEHALRVNPASAMAWTNRGHILNSTGRLEEALANYDHALVLNPEMVETHFNRGIVLRELNRIEEAVASYDRALELRRNNPDAWNNRGESLMALGRHEEALASYDQALKRNPGFAEALYNRGNVLRALGRYKEALTCWERAQRLKPDYANAHYNEALCHLLLGDYEQGWEKYEWRWQALLKEHRRDFSQPLWLGQEDINGKTILLYAEQGFGDTIQFCRYVKHVAALGTTVLLEVQPPLASLMKTLEGPSSVLTKDAPLPEFDFHTPLLSLPLACMATLGTTIPAHTPYLTVPPENMEKWRNESGNDNRLRVGLAWSGSPTHINDRNRSIPLTQLSPLLENGQANFISLQKDLRDYDQSQLAELPQLNHYGEHLQDFADTAALIATLDLVITVDTSVAHLAGALGKNVWIMLPHDPDWRWLLEIADSPWYPTAKLYRQPETANWDSVIQNITADLDRLSQAGKG